jgi:hypothetical protein
MVPLAALWLPILLSALLVFVVSSIIHMMLPYHRSDFRRVPAEDDVMAALRRFNIPPGDYLMPRPESPGQMNSPEFIAKRTQGPVLVMTILPPGAAGMARNLALWFVYTVVVGLFAAYVAALALPPGAAYRPVFRIAGTVAFCGYSLALLQNTIWYSRGWGFTLKSMFDGLIYALLTGGAFGWLWPEA